MAERSNSDCSYRAPALANASTVHCGAPILPHERNYLGHNLARIKWRTPFVKNVENYFTVTFPMGYSRRETIITPAAGIAPRKYNLFARGFMAWPAEIFLGNIFLMRCARIPPHTGLIARSADVLFYPQAIS